MRFYLKDYLVFTYLHLYDIIKYNNRFGRRNTKMNDIDVSPLFNKLSLALYKDSIERMKASGNFYNNVHVDLKSIDNETWLSKILKYRRLLFLAYIMLSVCYSVMSLTTFYPLLIGKGCLR